MKQSDPRLLEDEVMIQGTKMAPKLAAGLLWVVAMATAAQAAPVTEIRYACSSAQKLIVRQSGDTALVQFIDRSYLLRRARSSIGEKFLAAKAALIIDGTSAVFVAEDRLQLGECQEVSRIASAR